MLVAVDLSPDGDVLAPRLLLWVKQILTLPSESRVVCVKIIKTAVLGIDAGHR